MSMETAMEMTTLAWQGGAHPGRRMKLGLTVALSEGDHDGRTVRWSDVHALARGAEAAGFDALWMPDHLLARLPNKPEQGCWEVFTLLGALAASTSRLLLGPLVASTSFRSPALLAKMAAGLDEISGGRFILGVGAGWHEPEYAAFGYPFDHLADRFEEALQIIVPLLREGRVDFAGRYYTARDCVLRPRGPSRQGPPIWIGAKKPRMLRLAARYADGFNSFWHARPEDALSRFAALRAACDEQGRDPAGIQLSASTLVHVLAAGETADDGEQGTIGTAEEVAEVLAGFAEIGTQHLAVILKPADVRGVERFARVIELLDRWAAPAQGDVAAQG
jgi:probable F420-dependent oxidoreductase